MGASLSSENHQERLRECESSKNKYIKYMEKSMKAHQEDIDKYNNCIQVCDNVTMRPGDRITASSSNLACVQSIKLNYNHEDGEKKLEWMSYKQLDDCLNPLNHCSIDNGNITIMNRRSMLNIVNTL
tara:strand:- start:962 stop:1342 length:381 start_codon:yes stop_codon:yes gene_type:complete